MQIGEILGTAANTVLGGGITGLFGVVVNKVAEYQTKKLEIEANAQKYAHEIDMKKVDADIMSKEVEGRSKVAEVEASSRMDVAESQAFAASFNEPQRYSDPSKASVAQNWLLIALDFIRGLVRPGLTIYLCVLTTIIYANAQAILGNVTIGNEQAMKMVEQIIGTVLYLTTTCLLWWFGTRAKQKAPKL